MQRICRRRITVVCTYVRILCCQKSLASFNTIYRCSISVTRDYLSNCAIRIFTVKFTILPRSFQRELLQQTAQQSRSVGLYLVCRSFRDHSTVCARACATHTLPHSLEYSITCLFCVRRPSRNF